MSDDDIFDGISLFLPINLARADAKCTSEKQMCQHAQAKAASAASKGYSRGILNTRELKFPFSAREGKLFRAATWKSSAESLASVPILSPSEGFFNLQNPTKHYTVIALLHHCKSLKCSD